MQRLEPDGRGEPQQFLRREHVRPMQPAVRLDVVDTCPVVHDGVDPLGEFGEPVLVEPEPVDVAGSDTCEMRRDGIGGVTPPFGSLSSNRAPT